MKRSLFTLPALLGLFLLFGASPVHAQIFVIYTLEVTAPPAIAGEYTPGPWSPY